MSPSQPEPEGHLSPEPALQPMGRRQPRPESELLEHESMGPTPPEPEPKTERPRLPKSMSCWHQLPPSWGSLSQSSVSCQAARGFLSSCCWPHLQPPELPHCHQNYFMWGSGCSSSLLLLCLVDPRTVFVLDLFLLSGPTPATLVKLDPVLFPSLGYLETIFKGPLTNYFEFVLHVWLISLENIRKYIIF